MDLSRRTLLRGATATSIVSVMGLAACKNSDKSSSTSSASGSIALDGKAWNYDATNKVYWQLGKFYVAKPAAKDYETLAVFVPGAYFKGTKNSDGTYTAAVDASGTVGGFTASTAPIVFPVDTPGYAAQKPLTAYSYSTVSAYMKARFAYVHAGLRGKDSNGTGYTVTHRGV